MVGNNPPIPPSSYATGFPYLVCIVSIKDSEGVPGLQSLVITGLLGVNVRCVIASSHWSNQLVRGLATPHGPWLQLLQAVESGLEHVDQKAERHGHLCNVFVKWILKKLAITHLCCLLTLYFTMWLVSPMS